LVDAVGNTQTVAGPSIVVDAERPTISGLAQNGALFSTVAQHNRVQVTFDTPESITAVGGTLSVTLSGRDMPCLAWQAAPPNYTCHFDVQGDEGEGSHQISVSTGDRAGNSDNEVTNVTFDFTAPSLVSPNATPNPVGVNQLETLVLTPGEGLATAPEISVASASGTLAFQPAATGASTFTRTILASDPSGAYVPTVSMRDLAGNASVISAPPFTVDTVVPTISNLKTKGGHEDRLFSRTALFNRVSIEFDTPESLDAAGASLFVALRGHPVHCNPWSAQPPNYVCPYDIGTVDVGEGDGVRTVVVQTRDAAGNSASDTATITFDFTAPRLLSPSSAPAIVGIGQQESLTLTPSEELRVSPTLVVTGASGGSLEFGSFLAGTVYSFEYVVGAGDASDTYTPSLDMTDLVGNHAFVAGRPFVVDTKVPRITNSTITGGYQGKLFSRVGGYQLLTLTFNTSEAVGGTNGAVTASVAGHPMGCGSYQATAPNFACTFDVTSLPSETSGAKAIVISARDAAGNLDSANATVTFDFDAPTIVSLTPTLANVGVNQLEVLALVANEGLLEAPTLAVRRTHA
jgi:hypothetical protein